MENIQKKDVAWQLKYIIYMVADYERWKLPKLEYHLFWSAREYLLGEKSTRCQHKSEELF